MSVFTTPQDVNTQQPVKLKGEDFLVFRIGTRMLAFELREVLGVEEWSQLIPFPGNGRGVLGITAVHGDMLPVPDLCTLTGTKWAGPSESSLLVIVRSNCGRAVVAADEVVGLRSSGRGTLEPLPDGVAPERLELVRGQAAFGDDVVTVLNPAGFFEPGLQHEV